MQEAYEDAELQRILAEDSAIAELGIDVQRHGESLVVRGHVETEQRRADIGRRVAELVPQCLVLNEITVVTARRPDAPEELT